jgi:Na+/glutamate symporter
MSQQDNFGTGFVLGAIFGGVVGGIVGAVAASRRNELPEETNAESNLPESKGERFETEEEMEKARRSLEDKISQLNLAIDDVRHQLGNVNGTPSPVEMKATNQEN